MNDPGINDYDERSPRLEDAALPPDVRKISDRQPCTWNRWGYAPDLGRSPDE
jgi:hypothetical protein